ncbi:cytoplasmic dynein 1 light intermediate chain 2-like isoform X2 [Gigantopelta aegis]|uniref:cytoplasmic dynein 1 light intermediate chain 2-like isoform X2 n=1 Tax=Gigantopelta aegis TaxID=1735272 RepID=UPI001B88A977|nr:cytoplasmic dynein 1 light intermediate chain 2-like isoform X2 [Gigantopelta aegis]
MAPIGERNDRMGSATATEDSQNLWANILSEVQSQSASKLSTSRSLLVLGDNETGKTTLIAKLQGTDEPKKGSGLEYYYIDVKDEYRDEQATLNVWCLDGDASHTGLLRFALTEDNFADTLVLLVATMTHPWSILESLEKWVTILRDHLDRLKIPPQDRQEYEQSLVRFIQEYTEPEEGQPTSHSAHRGEMNPLHPTTSGSDEERALLPLGETILSQNLGIPIIVVITKSDAISSLEREHDYKEEHFDFIQQHVRKFCLKYGAALFYTSVKEDRNCDLFYKYLIHRIYGFPFLSTAYVVEKDMVFVPAGWDNEKKISILYENMRNMKPEDAFEDVIVKPVLRKPVQRDTELFVEEEQLFLAKLQVLLSKQPTAGSGSPAVEGTPSRQHRPGPAARQDRAMISPLGTSTPRAMKSLQRPADASKVTPGAANEGMLANFFNSLLHKKPGATMTTDKAAMTKDAVAELERMKLEKKTETNSNDTSASGS